MCKLLLLLTMLVTASQAMAEQRMYDRYGQEIGRVESTGRIYDRYGQDQGRIEADGTVYDRYGSKVGRIEPGDGSASRRGASEKHPARQPRF